MSLMHDPVLLHVGYIKTATTFLQNQVFQDPGAGLELAAGRQTRRVIIEEIMRADDYTFDAENARIRLEASAAEVRQRGALPVWSEEMLLGNPPDRRYDGFGNARKLHMVYPQARVLITIRQQTAMALSIWGEYVRGGGRLPLRSLIGTGQEPAGHAPVLHPEFLMFDRAIRHYQGLFGSERVLVLPQELLREDPARFYAHLSDFSGCQIDPDRPRRQAHLGEAAQVLRLRRGANHLIRIDPTRPRRQGVPAVVDRVLRRLDRLMPAAASTRVRDQTRAQIATRYAGMFAQSNRDTMALTGLDLGGLGYEV